MQGLYICFEGPDLSGKSTQAKRLTQWLSTQVDNKVMLVTNPGATKLGKELRTLTKCDYEIDPLAEAALFFADYAEFNGSLLRPEINKGTTIIADRNNVISSMAYRIAYGAGDGVPLDVMKSMYNLLYKPQIYIDLLFVFNITYKEAKNRMQNRTEQLDKYDRLSCDVFNKIIDTYKNISDVNSKYYDIISKLVRNIDISVIIPRIIHINGERHKDEIFEEIAGIVTSLLLNKT